MFAVEEANTVPLALTATENWVAVAASSPQGGWSVFLAFATMQTTHLTLTTPMLSSTDTGVQVDATPVSLDLSDDDVLAVCLGAGGVRLYQLYAPLPPTPERKPLLLRTLGAGFTALTAKWVSQVSVNALALVVWSRRPTRDALQVYGAVSTSSACAAQEVLTTACRCIFAVSATRTGYAVAVTNGLVVHLLKLVHDRGFTVKKIVLSTLSKPEHAPCCLQLRSVAVGTQLLAVGCDTANGNGVVEVFNIDSGAMLEQRELPLRSPTAVATSGMRVIVGGSSYLPGVKRSRGLKPNLAIARAHTHTHTPMLL